MKLVMMAALAAAIALAPGLAEAAQSKKPRVNRNTQPEHIACTKYCCHPIPPNCTPATQLDFWGNPTGYDRIVCR